VLGQHRSTQRKVPRGRDDEEALTADIIALAREYGRYGYRKITALLRAAGWVVNAKRVVLTPTLVRGLRKFPGVVSLICVSPRRQAAQG
jgi:hypothetical protein